MSYKLRIQGIVHALDPIFSEVAYARATFVEPDNFRTSANGTQLTFTAKKDVILNDISELSEALAKVVKGTDSNVEWTLDLKPTFQLPL